MDLVSWEFLVGDTWCVVFHYKCMDAKTCLFCCSAISDRNYRSIFPSLTSFYEILSDIVGENPKAHTKDSWIRTGLSLYVCKSCNAKLNRLHKVNLELTNRLHKLEGEKKKLHNELSPTFHGPPKKLVSTPKRLGLPSRKRSLLKTPTPKKSVKRALLKTPTRVKPIQQRPIVATPRQNEEICDNWHFARLPCDTLQGINHTTADKQIQVGSTQSDKEGTIKITIQYHSQQRAKVVKEPFERKLVKALSSAVTEEKLAGIIYKEERLRTVLHRLMCNKLSTECKNISSHTNHSCLLKKSVDDLCSISWAEIIKEWMTASPLMCMVLEAITSKVNAQRKKDVEPHKRHFPYIGMAGSVLLFHRNPKMCRIQTAVGLTLDRGGATDETISVMQRMGVSLSPEGLRKRKHDLLTKHDEIQKEMVGTFISQRESLISAQTYLHGVAGNAGGVVAAYQTPRMSTGFPSQYNTSNTTAVGGPSELLVLTNGAGVSLPTKKNGNILPYIGSPYSTPTLTCKTCNSSNHGLVTEVTRNDFPDGSMVSHLRRPDTTANSLRGSIYHAQLVSDMQKQWVPSIAALGDNFDLMVNPHSMTLKKQRESWHWFLLLASRTRITDPTLSDTSMKADILSLPTAAWLPSPSDLHEYESNLDFHIAGILVDHLSFLKSYENCVPFHIDHPYLKESRKRSEVLNVKLIDAPENDSNGILTILKDINKTLLPKKFDGLEWNIVERVVLGGDVLTNERAFSGQEALLNADDENDACRGIIHRPEGLHRLMNLLMGIYQEFYKEPATGDRAILYTLRNIVNRRDVKGHKDVTKAYRSHQAFVDDCLNSYVLTVACAHFQIDTITDTPSEDLTTGEDVRTKDGKLQWLMKQASAIRRKLLQPQKSGLQQVQEHTDALDDRESLLQMMFDAESDKYNCMYCTKAYVRQGNLMKHLQRVHSIPMDISEADRLPFRPQSTARDVIASFCRMALLYRDTQDAYEMADGNRIFRNAKLEMLYAFSLGHTKYRLWLWRMLAYEMALLSPREAFEYKWNCCVNLQGGLRNNIPNDNAVELQVGVIKKLLQRQGSNKSFQSALTICKTTQILDKVKDNLMTINDCRVRSRKRAFVNKSLDIKLLVTEIQDAKVLEHDIMLGAYASHKDPLERIGVPEFHSWVKEQKDIAAVSMIRNAHCQ